ncbi:MAG: DinB family protein [Bacteroidota bacterium]
MKIINLANIEVLNQLKAVLEQFEGIDYKKSLKILNEISIGQHTRHIIEFYQCLFYGQENDLINYDDRNRDLRIETDLEYAIWHIDQILLKLNSYLDDSKIFLVVSFGLNNETKVGTSFERELAYLIEHTIHHLAIINIAIKELHPEIIVPKYFGVAYSTIQYQENKSLTA